MSPDYNKWTKGRGQSIKSAKARELVRDVKQSIPDSNPSSWWMLPSDAQEQTSLSEGKYWAELNIWYWADTSIQPTKKLLKATQSGKEKQKLHDAVFQYSIFCSEMICTHSKAFPTRTSLLSNIARPFSS